MLFEGASTAGVIINVESGFDAATRAEGAVATLKKVGTDEWDLFGGLAEVSV